MLKYFPTGSEVIVNKANTLISRCYTGKVCRIWSNSVSHHYLKLHGQKEKKVFYWATTSAVDADAVGIMESVQEKCFCWIALPRWRRTFCKPSAWCLRLCPPCAGCRGGGDAKPAWCPENAVWRWVWVGLAHKDRRATMWELNTGLWVKGGPGRIRSPWRRLLLKSVSQGDPQMDRDVGSYRSPFWTEGRNIFSFFSLRSLFSHCTKKEESIIYVWQEN